MNYIIIGSPNTGKSTLADKLAILDPARVVECTDDYKGLAWSRMSDVTAEYIQHMTMNTNLVLEGCATVRGLRKWLKDHPEEPVPGIVVYLSQKYEKDTPQVANMSKGIATMWAEILPELLHRDCIIMLETDVVQMLYREENF